jgi:hypothetical protein
LVTSCCYLAHLLVGLFSHHLSHKRCPPLYPILGHLNACLGHRGNGRNAECCSVKQGGGFTGQGKQRGGPRTTDHRSTDRWGGESSARRFWGPQMGAHVEWHAPTNSNQAGHADRPEGEQMEVWFANALTCYTMRCRRKNRIVLAPNGSSSSNAPAIIPADSWLWSD